MIINLGFELRQKGSHHILTKDGIEEIINIQPKKVKQSLIKLSKLGKSLLNTG
jgi:predicted RNA binding protein YcfA (HicA-like mRNA interferase family)